MNTTQQTDFLDLFSIEIIVEDTNISVLNF